MGFFILFFRVLQRTAISTNIKVRKYYYLLGLLLSDKKIYRVDKSHRWQGEALANDGMHFAEY